MFALNGIGDRGLQIGSIKHSGLKEKCGLEEWPETGQTERSYI